MEHFVNEKTVMQFYLDKMDAGEITFLNEKEELKAQIHTYIEQLLKEAKMNNKISIAVKLCTALSMTDGWLNIDFEFNNANLDNLDPEISFKGRCKRFLTLFDVRNLSPNLKLRVRCIGKLPANQFYTK